MRSTRTQSQLCAATPISSFLQCHISFRLLLSSVTTFVLLEILLRYIYIWAVYIYIYIYIYTNSPINVIVTLSHPRSGDSQGQETFLVPCADKQTRNYDTECSNHPPSLSTLSSNAYRNITTGISQHNNICICIPGICKFFRLMCRC